MYFEKALRMIPFGICAIVFLRLKIKINGWSYNLLMIEFEKRTQNIFFDLTCIIIAIFKTPDRIFLLHFLQSCSPTAYSTLYGNEFIMFGPMSSITAIYCFTDSLNTYLFI